MVDHTAVVQHLQHEIDRQKTIISHLSEIIDSSNISVLSCGSCGWIDYEDKVQECHQGSGFRICDQCVCTCTESGEEDESDEDGSDKTDVGNEKMDGVKEDGSDKTDVSSEKTDGVKEEKPADSCDEASSNAWKFLYCDEDPCDALVFNPRAILTGTLAAMPLGAPIRQYSGHSGSVHSDRWRAI